jgi:ribulose-5-phosphate 4-epimerase/fuculose-1-phosphate aldolase
MTRRNLIDQAMRSSVDRAMQLQPRKARRVADELLYSVPAERETVAALRAAGARMVEAGLAVSAAGVVSAQHGSSWMTVTRQGTDLTRIDGRHLLRIALDGEELPEDAPGATAILRDVIRVGPAAAVWGHPISLLACAAVGFEPDPSASDDLAALAQTVTVIPGRGAVAAGEDPLDAVARLEAAERLAEITLAVRRFAP